MNDIFTMPLQRLDIAQATRDAINRYCIALDGNDLTSLAETLSEDMVLMRASDEPLRGRDAVLHFLAAVLADEVDHKKHLNTNIVVTDTGNDTASAVSYFLAFHHHRGEISLAWGTFHFKTRCSNGTARITELEIVLEVPLTNIGTLVKHM